ncbi:carboxypeptidase-like regulatory domain-containing protein [Silvibacterium sp.]|uniref:carboxypeptidase-like regulatory domain-containing protein n=1 Tax=Silvibacterium sp. TaxID=1964179 RepID=UPI0039E4674B
MRTAVAQRAESTGIHGVVRDPAGGPVLAAEIVVKNASAREACRTQSLADGSFACAGLTAGEYSVDVNATGYVEQVMPHILLNAAQPIADLSITLALKAAATSVHVAATTEEIATAQIHAAEKQRIIGVVPNFYTSFIADAAPLSSRQKFSLAFRDELDPVTFLSAGVSAGIEQARNDYKGYGQGAAGYGKRFAAAYGDGLTSDIFRHAVYASLFHEDPRYYYQGTGTFRSRFLHAISYSVILRGDDGQDEINYAYVAGYLTSGALSNAYYPHADRGAGLVFTRAAFGVLGTAGEGLLREFVWNHLTTHRQLTP